MLSDVFIRRPVLATVCSLLIILAGAISIPTLPIARYPELAPPAVSVSAFYTGANAQAVESAVTTPLEQAINGVEGMTYITSSSTNSGACDDHSDVRHRPRRRPGRRRRAEPRQPALGRMPAEVRTNGITVTKNTRRLHRRARLLRRGQPLQHGVHQQLPRRLRARRHQARAGCRRRADLRRAQVRDAAMARSARSWRRAGSPPATSRRRCASRTCRSRRARSAMRQLTPARCTDQRPRRRPPHRGRPVREHHRQGRRRRRLVRLSDVGRVELGAETYASNLRFRRPGGVGHRACSSALRQCAGGLRGRDGRDGPPRAQLSARARMAARLRQRRAWCASRSSRC